mgnify:CR=1 FL=1
MREKKMRMSRFARRSLTATARALSSSTLTPATARALSSSSGPPPLPTRAAFPHWERLQTRWNDNDMQGHVNNALYYGFVDDAINRHLLAHAVDAQYARFVAASSCRYVAPLSYPDDLDVGMRVTKIGSSSATYEVGLFRGAEVVDQDEVAAAVVDWVHVYVDAESGRPSPFDDKVRAVLTSLVTE